MPQYGLEPQVVMTFPLLVGTDGELKMSKSRGNYIGITEPPEEMFGKAMSIPDKALPQWWELLVGGEHPRRPDGVEARARPPDHRALARRGRRAQAGEEHFTRVVRRHEAPADVPELRSAGRAIPCICRRCSSTASGSRSTSEARRLIQQGGVKLNGEPAAGVDLPARDARGRSAAGRASGASPV